MSSATEEQQPSAPYVARVIAELQQIADAAPKFSFTYLFFIALSLGIFSSARILWRWPPDLCWATQGAVVLVGLTLILLQNFMIRRYRKIVTQRIAQSDIVMRLAVGTDWLAEIFDWTPWPLSRIFLGTKPETLSGWVKLLAYNLDWFTVKRKKLIRPAWIASGLTFALMLLLLFHDQFTMSYIQSQPALGSQAQLSRFRVISQGEWIVSGFFFLFSLMTDYLRYKQRIAAELLLAQMRERFDS